MSSQTTKITLKSKYHIIDFEIERLSVKKAIQCQKIMNAFKKIKGYNITSLSYGINGISSIELTIF